MKYLKRLYIKNFQSHKDTVIDFSPRLNILVGESDQGKTAVIRALRWLFYNKAPRGDFIRSGEDYCLVAAELSDGTVVSRIRGRKMNRYEIRYPDGTEDVEEKVGTQVPEIVQEILGNGRLYVDSDKYLDINIAYQLEPPFLLSETDGDKAKIIGLIADLDIIDAAARRLLQDINQANTRKRDLEEEIRKLNEELKTYDDLEDKKLLLKKGQEALMKVERNRQLIGTIQEMEDKWIKLNEEMAAVDDKLKEMGSIDQSERYNEKIFKEWENIRLLESLEERFNNAAKELGVCLQKLKKLDVLEELGEKRERIGETFKLLSDISDIEGKRRDIKEKIKKINVILQQTENLQEAEDIIAWLSEKRNLGFELQKIRKEIHDREKRLKEAEDILLRTQGLEKGEKLKNALAVSLDRCYRLQEVKQAYDRIWINYKQNLEKLKNIEENYSYLLNEYIKVLKEAGRCPVCNTEISEATVEQILESLN